MKSFLRTSESSSLVTSTHLTMTSCFLFLFLKQGLLHFQSQLWLVILSVWGFGEFIEGLEQF